MINYVVSNNLNLKIMKNAKQINRKFIITAELRDLEKQLSLGEISYERMVELLCEKADEYSQQFKSPYPKMMMVWADDEKQAVERKVIAEFNEKFIVGYEDGSTNTLLHAKDIEVSALKGN